MNFLEELQTLDTNNLGGTSNRVKIFIIVFLMALIIGSVFYLVVKDQRIKLEGLQKKE